MAQSKDLLNELGEVKKKLTTVLSSFSPAEINQVPFEGSWTAGQVGRHLLKAFGEMSQLLEYGNVKDTDRAPDEKMKMIKGDFLNFDIKMKSPDFLTPETKTYQKEELIISLDKTYTDIINTGGVVDLSKTLTDFEIPGYGHFTRLESVYFAICHTQRHIHQLKNIRGRLGK